MKTASEALKDIEKIQWHAKRIKAAVSSSAEPLKSTVDGEAHYIDAMCHNLLTPPPTPYVPWPTEPSSETVAWTCEVFGNRVPCFVHPFTDNLLRVLVMSGNSISDHLRHDERGKPTSFLRCPFTVPPVAEPEKVPERPAEMAAMSAIVDALNAAPKESHERMLKYINARFQTT